eukprot:CAMPEP_0185164696 /NCGR_PEP_ID=MMETSP1139-20130426/9771_1 /TAXON_ID=298111 /ORGANISM="Pavlova sp., Strain CCMP459" /LENGTH=488 /DNA_ID=CAMNT_0027730079 /DNA_START=142 /DNA_END=1605 /DNA_ORIENTATION=-
MASRDEILLRSAKMHLENSLADARKGLGMAYVTPEKEARLLADPSAFLDSPTEFPLMLIAAEASMAVKLLQDSASAPSAGIPEDAFRQVEQWVDARMTELGQRVEAKTLGLRSRTIQLEHAVKSLAATRAEVDMLHHRVEISEETVAHLVDDTESRLKEKLQVTMDAHMERLRKISDDAAKLAARTAQESARREVQSLVDSIANSRAKSQSDAAKLMATFRAHVGEVRATTGLLSAAHNSVDIMGTRLEEMESALAHIRGELDDLRATRAAQGPGKTVTGRFSREDVWGLRASGTTNFQGMDLKGVDLSGLDLGGCNLQHAYLSGANLSGAHLAFADLSQARLVQADVSGAMLEGAVLSRAQCDQANFTLANLRKATMQSSSLKSANMSEANLEGANLSFANLEEACLDSAQCDQAYFTQADLNKATMKSCSLKSANMGGANLQGANLEEACLDSAQCDGANFTQANLNKATMESCSRRSANMSQVNW